MSDVVAPYGLTRETVDGNDVLSVWETFGRFLAAARGGKGPLLLECLTYRLRGHYEGDPAQYREAIAAADWQEKDPILRLQRHAVRPRAGSARTTPTAIEREAREAGRGGGRASPARARTPPPALLADLTYA